MTLAHGWSPIFPIKVHQPASPSIKSAVPSLQRGLSTNPGVITWCVCVCSSIDYVFVGVTTEDHSGDGCDLRKGDLIVFARVRRVSRRRISSELLMRAAGVRNILLLSLVAGCLEKWMHVYGA